MANTQHTLRYRRALGGWAKKLGVDLDALARQVCQEMAQQAVENTPVVVGFLRGSWQPSVGKMSLAQGAAPDASGAAVSAKIAAVIADIKAGDVFYMMNNAVYAKRVEYGFVGQDSLGRTYNQKGRFFVTNTVKRWPLIVQQQAAALK